MTYLHWPKVAKYQAALAFLQLEITMESDEEATYTHFAHREAFFALFKRFLSCRLDEVEVESEQSDDDDRLVESIGAIVRPRHMGSICIFDASLRFSLITIFHFRLCWTLIYMRLYHPCFNCYAIISPIRLQPTSIITEARDTQNHPLMKQGSGGLAR